MPPKVKKSAKPKLTREEKKLKKLAKKEAARLKKIEQAKEAHRSFVARETRYTEKNIEKILEKWREIMRKARQSDLYDDFVSLQRSVEHQFDIKDSVIEMLLQMLDEANEQYNVNLSHHIETINNMLGIYATQIDKMNLWYRSKLEMYADELSKFRLEFDKETSRRMLNVEIILWSMEDRTQERAVSLCADTTAKTGEEMAKSGEKHQAMRAGLEQQQENQWLTLQNTINDHLKNTAERRSAVAKLTAMDQQAAAILQKQRKMTERAYESIHKLNRVIARIENSQPSTILTERNTLRAAQNSLRARMDRANSWDSCQMVHLVSTSYDVLQALKSLSNKGERIIRLANLCRRLETEDEKVVPFPEWAYGAADDIDEADEGYDDSDECETADSDEPESRTESSHLSSECLCVATDTVGLTPGSDLCSVVKDVDSCTSFKSNRYVKKLKKRVCELSTPISLYKTRETLKLLEPLWARVGRATIDVIDLGDVLNKLRSENVELKAQLMRYVRMRAPSSSSPHVQLRGPPCVPVMEPPPGYPARSKFQLLPPVETRL